MPNNDPPAFLTSGDLVLGEEFIARGGVYRVSSVYPGDSRWTAKLVQDHITPASAYKLRWPGNGLKE